MNSRRGLLKLPTYSTAGQSEAQVSTWNLQLACDVENWRRFCGTEPLTCGTCCYLCVDSVRKELNCRCQRIVWCEEKIHASIGIGCRKITLHNRFSSCLVSWMLLNSSHSQALKHCSIVSHRWGYRRAGWERNNIFQSRLHKHRKEDTFLFLPW